MQVLSKLVKIVDDTCKLIDGEIVSMNYLFHFFKLSMWGWRHVQLVKISQWIIDGCITKEVEQIVMDFGLLILNKDINSR